MLAIITGADGGMGTEITRAVARAGHTVVMACRDPQHGQMVCDSLISDTGNTRLTVLSLDLASLASVRRFAAEVSKMPDFIGLLMNNAGTMGRRRELTEDGIERTVSVNYVGPYLLTRLLAPRMAKGARVVNMVSMTYKIGRLRFPDFFTQGCHGAYWRIPVYSNTKLALTLFTIELSRRLQAQGVTVNCADPWIVSTEIIRMGEWFDPLTDLFFRPLIYTPAQGAATAIHLLLSPETAHFTGTLWASSRRKTLSQRYLNHPQGAELWSKTAALVGLPE